jgi:hypothetical protein
MVFSLYIRLVFSFSCIDRQLNFFILPLLHSTIGVEARFSLWRDVIDWRQTKTRGESRHNNVVVTQFAQADNGLLAGNDPVLDTQNTDNDLEMKRKADQMKSHTMAKVHDWLKMWQGSQNR